MNKAVSSEIGPLRAPVWTSISEAPTNPIQNQRAKTDQYDKIGPHWPQNTNITHTILLNSPTPNTAKHRQTPQKRHKTPSTTPHFSPKPDTFPDNPGTDRKPLYTVPPIYVSTSLGKARHHVRHRSR